MPCRTEAYAKVGQAEGRFRVISEALEAACKNGECFYEAELYRLQGELLLRCVGGVAFKPVPMGGAETSLQHALATARRQQAKALELRVATSLSRLWRQQGRSAEARQMLREVYDWFTEGFETADLQEAKILLETLRK